MERLRHILHQHFCHFQFVGVQGYFRCLLRHRRNLIMVVQRLYKHPLLIGIKNQELLICPHDSLCDCHFFLGKRHLAQQPIGFLRPNIRYGIILFIINGVDLRYLSELDDVDGLVLPCLNLLQVVIRHHHIFPLFIFVPFDDVFRPDLFIAVAAVLLIFNPRLALLIQLVKMDVIVNRGLIQPYRDQYQPHGNGTLVRNSHKSILLSFCFSG